MIVHKNAAEPWRVTVVDTGLSTMTGGRVRRVRDYIGGEPFLLTYGDGVADLDLAKLVAFHRSHGKLVTLSSYSFRSFITTFPWSSGRTYSSSIAPSPRLSAMSDPVSTVYE